MTAPPVVLTGVTVRFGAQAVLEQVSMDLHPATFLALIGPNAGGKTTLIRTILGQVRPAAGTVQVFGQPATELGALRTAIGYVPQLSAPNTRYPVTTRQVVTMGAVPQAGLLRRLPAETPERVTAILERVGLAAEAERNFHTLSGGQQQRAIVARALVPGPKLLLLDEPTGPIDTVGQTQLMDLLRELRDDLGLAILVVSHFIGELLPYVDRVACLNKTLHWHDKVELLSEAVLREVYGCELDAYFLQHHAHQEAFHGGEGGEGGEGGPAHDHAH